MPLTDNGVDKALSIDADGTEGIAQITAIAGLTGLTEEAAAVTSDNLAIVKVKRRPNWGGGPVQSSISP